MSLSVCQGWQSCLEPRLVETQVLRLKLATPKSNFSPPLASACKPSVNDSDPPTETSQNEQSSTNNNKMNSNDCDTKRHQKVDTGGWGFLQSLAKEAIDNNKVYVHPLVKRSSSMLSEKSLEMCTESLGSETGSDSVSESSEDNSISVVISETEDCEMKERSKSKTKLQDSFDRKRMTRSHSFPPPLTSISGSKGVQVRPHREGGRLVLRAVTVSTPHTNFHAERIEGRLRLCLLKDCSPICDNEEDKKEEDSEKEVGEKNQVGAEAEIEEKEEVDDEVLKDEENWDEDKDGNSANVGCEIAVRPSRCKEGGHGNKGLLDWEPCWVAT